jgi:cob(I)alamin adenosyltransferase
VKIYTKTGDSGETGIMGGPRLLKSDKRINAIGEVDELNAAIGLVRVESREFSFDGMLRDVQNWLFEIGSELASPNDGRFESISLIVIERIESSIDNHTRELPELKSFILPGGSELAARLHFARAVCRRAERALVDLDQQHAVRPEVKIFLNRLADYLFVVARTANFSQDVQDVSWSRGS